MTSLFNEKPQIGTFMRGVTQGKEIVYTIAGIVANITFDSKNEKKISSTKIALLFISA